MLFDERMPQSRDNSKFPQVFADLNGTHIHTEDKIEIWDLKGFGRMLLLLQVAVDKYLSGVVKTVHLCVHHQRACRLVREGNWGCP